MRPVGKITNCTMVLLLVPSRKVFFFPRRNRPAFAWPPACQTLVVADEVAAAWSSNSSVNLSILSEDGRLQSTPLDARRHLSVLLHLMRLREIIEPVRHFFRI